MLSSSWPRKMQIGAPMCSRFGRRATASLLRTSRAKIEVKDDKERSEQSSIGDLQGKLFRGGAQRSERTPPAGGELNACIPPRTTAQ